jgi:hypothetical protein
MSATTTLTATAQNPLTGETSAVNIVVPSSVPSDERCDYLRSLWDRFAEKLDDGHWKGRIQCRLLTVEDIALADDVAEAMNFYGAIVDKRTDLPSGAVYLFSKGYWAHGF